MRTSLLTVLLIVLVAAMVASGWHYSTVRAIESRADAFIARSQSREMVPVTIRVTVPETTPTDQTIYLSGSSPALGNWDAAGVPLVRTENGQYLGTVDVLTGIEYGYKVTRGTWGTVEKGPDGNEIDNRVIQTEGASTLDCAVATWVDKGKAIPGRITLTGDIRVIRKFPSEILDNQRDLAIYLPPNYGNEADRRYPVLYVQDGQNVFDESTSYAGVEWSLDEAAQRLIETGTIPPMIIVAVNNTEDRDTEYAAGSKYDVMLVDELMPMINERYLTLTGPDHTAVAGASLGGLATLDVAARHPDTFGTVIALSPWLRTADEQPVWSTWSELPTGRLYIDMGTAGGENFPVDLQLVDATQLASAIRDRGGQLTFVEIDNATHTESDWADRIDDVLVEVFGQK